MRPIYFLSLLGLFHACQEPIELPYDLRELPSDLDITDIYAAGGDTLYFTTGIRYQSGELWRSTDAGENWTKLMESGFDYNQVANDPQRLFLISSNNSLWYSSDGDNWSSTFMAKWDFWFSADFNSLGEGIIVGGKNFGLGYTQIFDSTPAFVQIDSSAHEWRDVCFTNDSTLFVVGYGAIAKSTNKGYDWQPANMRGDFFLRVQFLSDSVGYVLGKYGDLLKTIDAGTSWKRIQQGSTVGKHHQADMIWLDEQRGYIAGSNGLLRSTENGGKQWTTILGPEDVDWLDLELVGNELWVAGSKGRWMKVGI